MKKLWKCFNSGTNICDLGWKKRRSVLTHSLRKCIHSKQNMERWQWNQLNQKKDFMNFRIYEEKNTHVKLFPLVETFIMIDTFFIRQTLLEKHWLFGLFLLRHCTIAMENVICLLIKSIWIELKKQTKVKLQTIKFERYLFLQKILNRTTTISVFNRLKDT